MILFYYSFSGADHDREESIVLFVPEAMIIKGGGGLGKVAVTLIRLDLTMSIAFNYRYDIIPLVLESIVLSCIPPVINSFPFHYQNDGFV